jgi:hypothetical protein
MDNPVDGRPQWVVCPQCNGTGQIPGRANATMTPLQYQQLTLAEMDKLISSFGFSLLTADQQKQVHAWRAAIADSGLVAATLALNAYNTLPANSLKGQGTSTCQCGHARQQHVCWFGNCEVAGCPCQKFE